MKITLASVMADDQQEALDFDTRALATAVFEDTRGNLSQIAETTG